MDKLGKYDIAPFTKKRQNIALILDEGKKKHNIHGLIEVDVTDSRKKMKRYKNEKNKSISLTAWIITCIAKAVSENKIINTFRLGRRKTVVFEDIDIPIAVERELNGKPVTMAYIIRKANEKDVFEITREIRNIQNEKIYKDSQILGQNLTKFEKIILKSPLFIKKLAIVLSRRNAIFRKKHMGTIGVTAIGMKGRFPGWAIPLASTTSTLIVVGGISKKPGVIKNEIKIREYLNLTITVDHDIVDGGPLARFIDRLIDLIENSYGLENI
jgi:pyruvate/2-oxoglutarate dehydrogenase complex dihydrolipoamide acyltransferase (E2) component